MSRDRPAGGPFGPAARVGGKPRLGVGSVLRTTGSCSVGVRAASPIERPGGGRRIRGPSDRSTAPGPCTSNDALPAKTAAFQAKSMEPDVRDRSAGKNAARSAENAAATAAQTGTERIDRMANPLRTVKRRSTATIAQKYGAATIVASNPQKSGRFGHAPVVGGNGEEQAPTRSDRDRPATNQQDRDKQNSGLQAGGARPFDREELDHLPGFFRWLLSALSAASRLGRRCNVRRGTTDGLAHRCFCLKTDCVCGRATRVETYHACQLRLPRNERGSRPTTIAANRPPFPAGSRSATARTPPGCPAPAACGSAPRTRPR